jgi:hypothetical protein
VVHGLEVLSAVLAWEMGRQRRGVGLLENFVSVKREVGDLLRIHESKKDTREESSR